MTNASGTKDKASAGDPIPPKCSVIEVHVGELKQLFNAIDPSPFEIFLYNWWLIRDEARLYDRLAAMPVRIRYLNAKEPDAWRGDWPAVSPRGERATGEAQPRALNQAS